MHAEYVAVRSAGALRSCIFLSWEDAAPVLASHLQTAEYKLFRSPIDAEAYIRSAVGWSSRRKRKAPPAIMPSEATDDEEERGAVGDDDDDSEGESKKEAAAPKALYGASSYRPTKKWEAMFALLSELRDQNGSLPEVIPDPKLKAWACRQNFEYNKLLKEEQSSMSEEKIERLKAIGFVFTKESADSNENEAADWNTEFDIMMEKLVAFRNEYGDCRVMRSHEEHRDLFNWIVKIRKDYQKLSEGDGSKCRLSARQLQRLTDIGFLFRQKEAYKTWEERMKELVEFVEAGNDINEIPTSHPEMGEFVSRQRKEYRRWVDGLKTAMTKDRIDALEAVGFDWNLDRRRERATLVKPKTWQERYLELLTFKQQHGHTLVPQAMEGGLGNWVKAQRQALKAFSCGQKSSLSADKVSRLTAVGFVVDVKDYRKRQKHDGPEHDYEPRYEPPPPPPQQQQPFYHRYRI